MIIPIGTEVRLKRPPVGNYALIAVNVLVFLVGDVLGFAPLRAALPALNAAAPSLSEYLTYQFRHGDVLHLAGNMFFLWIFGNAVCDRMGSRNYLVFYLAGGVFAGFMFSMNNQNPMIGASGAIAAVTTAFLVLFPSARLTLLLWAIFVIPFELPAIFVIVFKIILWDNILAPAVDGQAGLVANVAYSAHLGGYGFGFVVGLIMLLAGALPRSQFDLLTLWTRWRTRTGAGPTANTLRAPPSEQEDDEAATDPLDGLRERTLAALARRQLSEAVDCYDELASRDPDPVLPARQQLEIANTLAQMQRYPDAVRAYEQFLVRFPDAPDAAQVRLLAGLLYSRYLHDLPSAARHLRAALDGLVLDSQRDLALHELQAAESQLR